jgi:hypothetical protein
VKIVVERDEREERERERIGDEEGEWNVCVESEICSETLRTSEAG